MPLKMFKVYFQITAPCFIPLQTGFRWFRVLLMKEPHITLDSAHITLSICFHRLQPKQHSSNNRTARCAESAVWLITPAWTRRKRQSERRNTSHTNGSREPTEREGGRAVPPPGSSSLLHKYSCTAQLRRQRGLTEQRKRRKLLFAIRKISTATHHPLNEAR